VFVAHNKIAISNFHMKTSHIALYGVLFQKLHKNMCGTIFRHSSILRPIELQQLENKNIGEEFFQDLFEE